ncbi:hypothetical protein EV643_1593 [Kribbella sp. VKM Ac-2527]|uniref:Uncharacterized protein n=1 Tax=Kribbella caucasensis TaxID=2512215 RepID=A0A4R6IYJ1_9ACTN|nr:hypothetical protein [Kribbella sp. VKM Ac-2527]TDO27491.1 hypothetical protein EV643_1593 [Kribbella sp. VKM Ac-2527]
MNSEDLKSRALALRAAGNSPKQIARMLGIPRAKAVSLVHSVPSSRPLRGDTQEKPLVGCWVTRQWSNGLTIENRPSDWTDDDDLPPLAIGAGLTSVAVVREHSDNEVSVCGYLVDTYCQGVKNAYPPAIFDRRDIAAFLTDFFSAYEGPPLPAPLELAQDLVLGAVDYAETLGFEPQRDFYLAKPHLGAWQPPSRIGFGLHGKPYFQQGPYDDANRVMRILDRSVGPGNYHFTTEVTIDIGS